MKLAGLFFGMAAANTTELFTGTKQVGEYMSKIANMADESDDIKRPCIRQFMEGCLNCVENIQLGHPFCIETNPNYNPIACVIVLNKCLIEELDGILECPQ